MFWGVGGGKEKKFLFTGSIPALSDICNLHKDWLYVEKYRPYRSSAMRKATKK